jgi:hypothetical protein
MSMGWIPIVEKDVLIRLSASELSAFRTAATGSGDTDPVAECIQDAVELCRRYVAGCPMNLLAAGELIPAGLKKPVCDIIALDIQSRAAGLILDPDGQRRKNADRAYKILEDVAACRIKVEKPGLSSSDIPNTAPSPVQPGIVNPSIHSKQRHTQFGRREQNGI